MVNVKWNKGITGTGQCKGGNREWHGQGLNGTMVSQWAHVVTVCMGYVTTNVVQVVVVRVGKG